MRSSFSVQDKVRIFLNSQEKQYIAVSNLTDLATVAGMEKMAFYQALYRLQTKKEVEIESEILPNGRKRVVGIKIIKMSDTPKIFNGAQKEIKVHVKSKPEQLMNGHSVDHIAKYLQTKHMVDDFATKLSELNVDSVQLSFTPDPMGEEAVMLLDLLERAQVVINTLTRERDEANGLLNAANETIASFKQSKAIDA